MRPNPFDYYTPSSLAEALNLLSKIEGAKILAGGQSLISLMKLRLLAPSSLIDINHLTELDYIREEGQRVVIGALTRHDEVARSSLLQNRCTLLSEAASVIADQQVRNRGTIGGSLAHADPSADLPAACMALDGEIEVAHETGSRTIATNDFFLDFFTTSLKEDEIIKELHIPLPSPRSGGAYTKMTKGHNDFALVAVAAQTSLNVEGTCERANIVVGGVGSKPMHAGETEKAMLGRRIDDGMLREAAMKATDDLTLTPDPRVSSEVKGEMVRALTLRTLRKALDRARGVV